MTKKPSQSNSRLVKIWVKFVYSYIKLPKKPSPLQNPGYATESIRFNCIIAPDFITNIFVYMLIAVLISSFFQVTHKNSIIKALDSIPHPLNLNLFGEMLTLALAEDLEKSNRCPPNCTSIKHKTKIGRTIMAKKFQLPYTAVILLTLKLQKIDCALEQSISLLYSE